MYLSSQAGIDVSVKIPPTLYGHMIIQTEDKPGEFFLVVGRGVVVVVVVVVVRVVEVVVVVALVVEVVVGGLV